ncbi:MAG: hypothetical protein ACOYOK_09040, partial [Pseudobdellovibrionaceae bacterium]
MFSALLSQFFGKNLSRKMLYSLPIDIRKNLILNAKALFELSQNWEVTFPSKVFLANIQRKFDCRISELVSNNIGPADEFEIWTLDGKFLSSSNQFFKLTSWSIEDLLT